MVAPLLTLLIAIDAFKFWPNANGFAEAEVEGELGWPIAKVDGNNLFTRNWSYVEVAQRGDLKSAAGVRLVAKAGRSLNAESPFKSVPVVRLKGEPLKNKTNGLTRKP